MRFAAFFKIYQILKLKFLKFDKILQFLSLLCSARYFSLSTELNENVTSRSAGRRKNHAIGEIWRYLCERSEKSTTKNHKK